jgi:hypothetical protein
MTAFEGARSFLNMPKTVLVSAFTTSTAMIAGILGRELNCLS